MVKYKQEKLTKFFIKIPYIFQKRNGDKFLMNRSKKGIIVTSSLLVGILLISATILGFINYNHKVKVDNARIEVQTIQSDLKSLHTQVASFTNKDGYIKSGFTLDKLQPIEKELNSYKDSYTDFGIKKNELKNEIKVVKIDKKAVTTELSKLKTKYEVQEAVNSLFSKGVLDGDKLTESPVKDGLTAKDIEDAERLTLEKVESPSKWSDSINQSIKLATAQVKQQDVATKEVGKLISKDKVKDGLSRDAYNKAKKEVDKVKNEKVKTNLNKSLNKVLKVVKADEKKAKEQKKALEKMQTDAETKVQSQSQSSTSNTTSSNGQSTYSSNTGDSSNQSSSYSGGSSSNSTSVHRKSSGSSSNATTKSSGTSNSTSKKTSGGSSSSKTPKISNVQKRGEGVISNPRGNTGPGASTYEWGTFQIEE